MWVTHLDLRDFRSYARAEVELGAGVTVVHGHNGAGKTNLLEGLYFGCTGRSCRTRAEREMLRFGAGATRAQVRVADADGGHVLGVGFAPGEPKRLTVDGAEVERLSDSPFRPLIGVFLPERLELIKGAPGLRRAHLDQVVGALWPSRSAHRLAYAQALSQRNALLSRVRAGRSSSSSLSAWDLELARQAIALRDDRAGAIERLRGPFADHGQRLGLLGTAELRYRPRSTAPTAEELAEELAQRWTADLERGFTGHGPHRDELLFLRDERDLKAFGSQGEQRLALLALLLAERDVITDVRRQPPLLLLDDVMSELDRDRRELLAGVLGAAGQSVITATEPDQVPGAQDGRVARLSVADGRVLTEAAA